jgi:hypothetical protein
MVDVTSVPEPAEWKIRPLFHQYSRSARKNGSRILE